jgi:hypothetical protein
MPPHLITLRSNLVLFSHLCQGLPSGHAFTSNIFKMELLFPFSIEAIYSFPFITHPDSMQHTENPNAWTEERALQHWALVCQATCASLQQAHSSPMHRNGVSKKSAGSFPKSSGVSGRSDCFSEGICITCSSVICNLTYILKIKFSKDLKNEWFHIKVLKFLMNKLHISCRCHGTHCWHIADLYCTWYSWFLVPLIRLYCFLHYTIAKHVIHDHEKHFFHLTPWSRVLEKVTCIVIQLVKKFPAFFETKKFSIMFTKVCYCFLSWAVSIPHLHITYL